MSLHNVIIVAAITLLAYWTLGTVLYWVTGENDSFAAYWCMGAVYWLLYLLLAPWRMIKRFRTKRGDKK